MKEYFEFNNPVKLLAGKHALDRLPYELSSAGLRKPLLIADKGVEAAGLLKILKSAFSDSEIQLQTVFLDVPPDSGTDTVTAAAELYRKNSCDCIIAAGGGSVLDTAKGVNILVSLGGNDLHKYAGAGLITGKLKPLFAVPTTAGTGSEVTLVAVIMDKEKGQKLLFVSSSLLPCAAVIDPRMTLTVPPLITAATGMDALSHAVEACTGLGKNPFSDAYAYQAVKLIKANLIKTVKNPSDIEGRSNLALGACAAGIAFSNSMVGLVHSLGHAAGAVCHIHHGMAMNIFLPAVLKYNKSKILKPLAELLLPLGGNALYAETPESEKADSAISLIEKLKEDLYKLTGLPRTLSETGKVSREVFPEIAKAALNDASIAYNIEEADYEDCLKLLEEAW
jgi:alcohol dehydrogenase